MFGSSTKIYLHSGVSDSRETEIAKYGLILRVKGTYDDSVRQCAADSRNIMGQLQIQMQVAGMTVPRLVMQGYTVLAQVLIN